MGAEIDDLYVLLTAQTGPLVAGFLEAGTAGEEMAAKIAASVAEITASVDRMAENWKVAGGEIDASMIAQQAEVDRLRAATVKASLDMEAAQAKAAASTELVGEKMAATSNPLGKYASGLGVATLVTAAVAGATVKMAGDFQASTEKLVTTAGESQSQLGYVRDQILNMAGTVGYSAMELSNALYRIEPAGFHGAAGLSVLKAAAEGAKTEQANLTTVGDALSTMLLDFHMKGTDAAAVMSKMVQATSSGKMSFEELAGSLSSIAPAASAAGIKMDDMLGVLANMTQHGMSAQQATQNMADALRHLQNPTGVMRGEMNLLGISADDVAAHLGQRGLAGTMQMLEQAVAKHLPQGTQMKMVYLNMADALKKTSPQVQDLASHVMDGSMSLKDFTAQAKGLDVISAKQAMSFATLAGQTHQLGTETKSGAQVAQSYGGALAKAMGDATGLKVALMTTGENAKSTNDAIKKISGATAEAGGHVKGWAEVQGNFNTKMSQAKDGLGALAISVGEKLLPAATKLAGALATGATWLAKHKDVAAALAIVLGTATTALSALMLVYFAIQIKIKAAAAWQVIYSAVTGEAGIAAKLAAAGQWLLNAAMAAFPAFLIIALIVAVVVGFIYLWNHCAGFRNFFIGLWKDIKAIALAVGHWFAHDFVDFFVGLWHDITAVWDKITAFFKKWWPLLLVIFAPFLAVLIGLWNRFHTQVIDAVVKAWDTVKSKVEAAWKWISDKATALWNEIHQHVITPLNSLWQKIVALWNQAMSWLAGVWAKISSAASAGWNAIYNAVISPFVRMYNTALGWANKFVDIGRNIINGIINGISNAAGALYNKLSSVANSALKAAKSVLGISSPSKAFAEEIGKWIPHGIAEGIAGAAGVARDAVAGLAGSLTMPAINVGVAGVAGGIAATAASGVLGGTFGGGPSLAGALGGQPILAGPTSAPTQLQLYIDGNELRNVTIRQAQQTKLRNGSTFLT